MSDQIGIMSIVASCQANIAQVVALSGEMGAKVVVTMVFPVGKVPLERRPFWSDEVGIAIAEVNDYIRSLQNVHVFDAYAVLIGDGARIKQEYSHDLLHLNEAGYQRLNEEFVRFLEDLE